MVDRLDGIDVAIIGAGLASDRHIKAQKDLGSRITIFDKEPGKAEARAQEFEVDFANSLDEALGMARLVYICTPDNKHTKVADQVIAAGIDIFCEKPLTTSLAEAEYLEEAASKAGINFFAGHYLRRAPAFWRAKALVEQGQVGPVNSLFSSYSDNIPEAAKKTPWRWDVSLLWGGGPHVVDTVMWIADEPVVKVNALTGVKHLPSYPHPELIDIHLDFQSGLYADLSIDALTPEPTPGVGLIIEGQEGLIETFHNSKEVHLTRYNGKPHIRAVGPLTTELQAHAAARIINQYLLGEKEDHYPIPNIHQAMPVMRVLDAVQRSIDTREPVRL